MEIKAHTVLGPSFRYSLGIAIDQTRQFFRNDVPARSCHFASTYYVVGEV